MSLIYLYLYVFLQLVKHLGNFGAYFHFTYKLYLFIYFYYTYVQCEIDTETGEPTDTLAPLAKTMIDSLGSQCTTVSGVIESKDKAVFTAVTEGLERANKHAVANAQKVSKCLLH